MKHWYPALIVLILLNACARMGRPQGGDKDTTPPKLLKAIPPANSTAFNGRKITLYFDEYVQLDNPFTQIVISPPLKIKPAIKPIGYPSKKIEIIFKNNLRPNTTYTIYFGNAIKDYREGNVLKDFVFVFSTGKFLDSLKLKGRILTGKDFEIPENVTVGLYQAENFKDSIVLNGTPFYLTKAGENGHFRFQHLSPGKYRIVAFSDNNHDYRYQPGEEQVAFLNETVRIPGTDSLSLRLFSEPLAPVIYQPEQKTMHLWVARAEGDLSEIKPQAPGKEIFFYTAGNPKKKTLNIWIKPVRENESFHLTFLRRDDSVKTFKITIGKAPSDTLLLKINQNTRYPSDTIFITSTQPILTWDSTRMDIRPAKVKCTRTRQGMLAMTAPGFAGDTLNIKFYPNSVTGFTGQQNKDTLFWKIPYVSVNKTGSWKGIWTHAPEHAYLIGELTDQKGRKVLRRIFLTQGNTFEFQYLKPGKYRFRILVDQNRNGRWDTGNFLQKQQPEPVYHYPRLIEIRANWHSEEKF